MWADNETRTDLLGFDYLVDSLEVVLTEPRLLPVTVGVLGDWGSGKTSLLHMVADRLGGSGEYVVVEFSPWRYEAYDDVKAALMDAVLTKLEARIPRATDPDHASGLVRRLRAKVARIMRGPGAAGKMLAPAVGGAVAAQHGVDPALGAAAGRALVAGVEAVGAPQPELPSTTGTSATFESVSDFRDEFEELIDGLPEVKATVVLVDDLDRCLDDTIIDVFEAIRLFLQVSRTAFVIAANRSIVQAAIEGRYPAKAAGDPALGKDYLEKIVQIEVTVPPLAAPEAETYLNLLFADLRLGEEDMAKVRAEASARRRQGQFAVAMNYGIAKGVLDEISADLEADMTIANRIAPALSRGLRGNPRQLKRFLNMLLLRLATARRRGVDLDAAVLAKLMVLEQQQSEFQQLFLWQLNQDGVPSEVAIAEKAARERSDLPKDAPADLAAWFSTPAVRQWLHLEPALVATPLGGYFFFCRDRLSPAAPGARLSAPMQALLGRLQAPTVAQRRKAIDDAAKVSPEEFTPLYEALLDRARQKPGGEATNSAIELAGRLPAYWPVLTAALGQIPAGDVPAKLAPQLALVGRDRAEVAALFDDWESSTATALKKAVKEARKAGA